MEQNKMATVPIPKLLLNMGLPMILSMVVEALYNVVDTFYVSHIPDTSSMHNVGEMAINALTLAFPIQMLIVALGVGTGVGINAMVSRYLGMKQKRKAEQVAGNALFVSVLYFIALFLFGVFGAHPFISSQTDNPIIAQMGTQYVSIVSIFSFGVFVYLAFEKITVGTGNTKIMMFAQSFGAITNIILDPIFIYGWFGLPAMGVRGAAIATVTGQFVSLFWIIQYYVGKKRILTIHPSDFYPQKEILEDLYRIGLPAIMMQLLVPIMSYVMNIILGQISESAVTAYGIYYKLQNFIFMAAYGLNNASIPIISFNYGAKNYHRIVAAIRWAMIDGLVIMGVGFVLMQGLTGQIVSIFAVSKGTIALCVWALRIIAWGFFFAGANIILQGVCQALGNGNASLGISLVRLILVPLPVAYLISHMAHAQQLVWLSIPLGELCATILAIFLTLHLYKERLDSFIS